MTAAATPFDRLLTVTLWACLACAALFVAVLIYHLWQVGMILHDRPATHDTYYVVHHFHLFGYPLIAILGPLVLAAALWFLRRQVRRGSA